MQRIAIIGNAGGGKSVLARQLGASLALPVFVIDDVQFLPRWQRAPLERVAAAQHEWLARPGWVIDGWGSWELIEQRFDRADTIVIVDYPMRVHYQWALRRHVGAMLGLERGWPPPGCKPWPVTRELFRVMRRVDRELRPRLIALANEPRFRERLAHIRSPRELRAFRERASAPAASPRHDDPR